MPSEVRFATPLVKSAAWLSTLERCNAGTGRVGGGGDVVGRGVEAGDGVVVDVLGGQRVGAGEGDGVCLRARQREREVVERRRVDGEAVGGAGLAAGGLG